jgi:hypothetical protein
MKWHQSPRDLQKNYDRVRDIVKNAKGDLEKETTLSRVQANRITDEAKAINRAMAAKDLGYDNIHDIFFRRAYELGAVDKQDFRNYQLKKLGII